VTAGGGWIFYPTALCLFLGPFQSSAITNQQEKIMTTTTIGELDLESAAKEAGNWMDFDCFSWDRANEIEDADQFCIVYTRNRDSELVEISNAEAIAEAMEPFLDQEPCDIYEEHHIHFGVGWVGGYAIRVFRDGEITEAFRTYHELQQRLAEYHHREYHRSRLAGQTAV
jgi:hypothetical protein